MYNNTKSASETVALFVNVLKKNS